MLSHKAWELSRRLFDLCGELTAMSIAAQGKIGCEAALQFSAAVEAVKAAQSELDATELVVDAARDPKDQSFAKAR